MLLTLNGSTKTRFAALCALAIGLAMFAQPSYSITIYGPGGTHSVNHTIFDDIQLTDGARVHLGSGARVFGNNAPSVPGFHRASAITLTAHLGPSRLKVDGDARVIVGEDQVGIMMLTQGEVVVAGNAYIGGGIIADDTFGMLHESPSEYRTRLLLGGNAVIDGNVVFSGYLNIADNVVINGSLVDDNSLMHLDMSGGLIRDRVFLASAGDYIVNMRGGTMLGGLTCWSSSACRIQIKAGQIAGGFLSNNSDVDLNMSGGRVEGGMRFVGRGRDTLRVHGGQIDASLGDWLLYADGSLLGLSNSLFEVYGGQWGYAEQGLGWYFGGNTDLTLYGMGIEYVNGYLMGMLSDGNWINVALTFGDDWTGNFNIVAYDTTVPEPGSLGLLGIGLIGLGFARHRKFS